MKIKVLPSGVEFEVNTQRTLLEQCLDHGIAIRSVCKGVPSCAECRVKIVEGASHVLPPAPAELHLLGSNYFLDGRRLSCQCRVFGPITVDVSEHSHRPDETHKKVRGIPQDKLKQSQAVISTMVLDSDSPAGAPTKPQAKARTGGR